MNLDLAHRRLHNQRLTNTDTQQLEEVVAWLGAVQVQEYAHAKWALGLRAAWLSALMAGFTRACQSQYEHCQRHRPSLVHFAKTRVHCVGCNSLFGPSSSSLSSIKETFS